MRPGLRLLALLALTAPALGCRSDRSRPAQGEVRLLPSTLALPDAVVGGASEAALEVHNDGRAPLELQWQVSSADFTLVGAPGRLAGGATAQVAVRFTPAATGEVQAQVEVTSGVNLARTDLRARGLERPGCQPSAPCLASTFDEASGLCLETALPDGTACDPGTRCSVGAACRAGRCVGQEVTCDDGDACTVDVCRSETGCAHLPAPPCPGDGRCRVGVCDPSTGCGLAPAPDGEVCGRSGCDVADVCIGGACVERDPPDGFVCAHASPCQPEGRCAGSSCVRPPATPLAPDWDQGAPLEDGGVPEQAWSDVLLSPADDVTLGSYFLSPPRLSARTGAPVDLPTQARRCIHWGALLVCADHPTTVAAGVTALEAASGAVRWTYQSVLAELPALAAPDHNTFLARLAVLSSTRLAAVFETRRMEADGSDSNCRTFSVVTLDRAGAPAGAWTLSDPLFSRCVHPHSFGVAADADGNLYFAFTPSLVPNPATPADAETLLASYDFAGELRWKRTEASLPGGELAVGRGVLLHEHSDGVFDAATGNLLGTLPARYRLGALTRGAVLAGPEAGGDRLAATALPLLGAAWDFRLAAPETFASDVLRLAAWSTPAGARTVALGFTSAGAGLSLLAVDAATGLEAFRCPVDLPGAPSMAEVGAEGLAAMVPYLPPPECVRCDPRWARTRNRFLWLPLPKVGRAHVPWSGTHGGPGHDHQEDAVP